MRTKHALKGWRGNKCISAKIKLSRMKQPAFVKLLQDSSHNSTNMNTITRIIKCVLHFNVKVHIFSYCERPDDNDEKCKKLKSSKSFKNIHSIRNLLLLKFEGHTPKKETRKRIELFSVFLWFLLNRKGKGQWKCVC